MRRNSHIRFTFGKTATRSADATRVPMKGSTGTRGEGAHCSLEGDESHARQKDPGKR
jgi:hypothetical protein